MQRGLALFFKFEHGSPILGLQLKNRQAGASSPGAPERQTPISQPARAWNANSTGARPPKDRGSYGAC